MVSSAAMAGMGDGQTFGRVNLRSLPLDERAAHGGDGDVELFVIELEVTACEPAP